MTKFPVPVHAEEILGFLSDRVREHHLTNKVAVRGGCSLRPGKPGHIAFDASRGDDAYHHSAASLVIVTSGRGGNTLPYACWIAVEDPKLEFARVTRHFGPERPPGGTHPRAWVDPLAVIDPSATIGPGVVVGAGVRVGARTQVMANVVLCDNVTVGDDVVIGPGCIIGHSGFGYAKDSDGRSYLLPHTGAVSIGDRVEIGANVTIDRGTFTDTVVEDDVMIDNTVQIAHNCVIGRGSYIIGHAAIGGSVVIGEDAWIAPNSTLLQHVSVAPNATVGMAAAVFRDVQSGQTVVGNPARPTPAIGRS